MRIKNFKVQNYKSWNDSTELSLNQGLNLIVGQNNAGKSALLEAMSLTYGDRAHRTLATKPYFDSYIDPNAKFTITFVFQEDELFRLALKIKDVFFAPLPHLDIKPNVAINTVLEALRKPQTITATFLNRNLITAEFESSWYTQPRRYFLCHCDALGKTIKHVDMRIFEQNQIGVNTLAAGIIENVRERIFLSRAERYNVAEAQIQNNVEVLDSSSNNLAQVLHNLLTGNTERFNKIVRLLSKVFPKIKSVTIPMTGSNAQVVIWPIDLDSERKDLAIPLSESGTGVGQVLAMLYIIINSDYPQCLLIDEPQSFLHPGAIRSLMEIFKKHDKHQYIITTHSPNILSASSSQVIHVKHDGTESSADIISGIEATSARLILEDLGFKLVDVFGADKILWVEGSTEEECFKLIVSKLETEPIWGVEILGVRNTGDLIGRHAETVYDIYNTLSKGVGIIPPVVGFIFDREMRTDAQILDLKRKSNGRVHFLKRRMFENYLLNATAIADLMNEINGFSIEPVDSKAIEEWVIKHGNIKDLYNGEKTTPFDELWLREVHGAEVLRKLFLAFSDSHVLYDKVKHGYALTEKIIEEDVNAFKEIQEIIKQASQI